MKPKPKEGIRAYKNYLQSHVEYPYGYLKKGRVVLMVEILQDGTLGVVEVKRGIGKPFEKEAIRLVREGPLWNPGTKNAIPQIMKVRVVVHFKP